MNDKIGKLGAGYAWLFALSAIAIGAGSAYVTAGLGAKVSSAVFFGVFVVFGFAATALTKAKALMAVAAFLLASLASAGAYYVVAAQAMAEATSALGAADAGGALGAAIGAFVAVITFIVSAVGGVGGTLAGARVRKQALAAA